MQVATLRSGDERTGLTGSSHSCESHVAGRTCPCTKIWLAAVASDTPYHILSIYLQLQPQWSADVSTHSCFQWMSTSSVLCLFPFTALLLLWSTECLLGQQSSVWKTREVSAPRDKTQPTESWIWGKWVLVCSQHVSQHPLLHFLFTCNTHFLVFPKLRQALGVRREETWWMQSGS